jgi:hypothetical protein
MEISWTKHVRNEEVLLRVKELCIFLRCTSCFNFSTYNVAYTQLRQDHFGLPEDGAPEAPKHVGASWYFKYMGTLKNAFSWFFFHHNLKMHGPSCTTDTCFAMSDWRRLGWLPIRESELLIATKPRPAVGSSQPPTGWRRRDFLFTPKIQGRDVLPKFHHPTTANVKDERSCTSTLPYFFVM